MTREPFDLVSQDAPPHLFWGREANEAADSRTMDDAKRAADKLQQALRAACKELSAAAIPNAKCDPPLVICDWNTTECPKIGAWGLDIYGLDGDANAIRAYALFLRELSNRLLDTKGGA